MEKILKLENHKKNSVIVLYLFFSALMAGSVLVLAYVLREFILETPFYYSVCYLLMVLLMTFGFFKFTISLFKVLVNYNKLAYLKYEEHGFSYLQFENLIGKVSPKNLIFETMDQTYFKPKFINVSFLYVAYIRISQKNNGEIEIVYENNRVEKLPLLLTEKKAQEGVALLKQWLNEYRRNIHQ